MEPTEESRGVNLLCLLESGKFSDLELSCEGGDFAVHKAIICAQSRVISAECEGNFEVYSFVDGSKTVYLLTACDRNQQRMSSRSRNSTRRQSREC